MMSIFRRAANELRRRGVLPATSELGGAIATYTTVIGYTEKHLALSFVAAALFSVGVSALGIIGSGHWIASPSDRAIVEGVKASGVEVESLSAADIRARLSYSPEEGRVLVDAIHGVNKELLDDLVKWLLTMDIWRRREAVDTVLTCASGMGTGAGKQTLARALVEIDEATAASLGEPHEIAELLRQLASVPAENRRALAAAKFPIRPADLARAEAWAVINAWDFPAADLVAPLKEIARAQPSRLSELRKYIKEGSPLTQCKPFACTPSPCRSSGSYTCDRGYYLTDQSPICVPSPK